MFEQARWTATQKTGSAYYAAYGSNLNLSQMLNSRCPNAEPITKFVLKGWRLVFRGVADIVQDPEASVPVGIFKITPACERALDGYEGYPHLYTKAQADLVFADGTRDKVMFYVMTNGTYESSPGQGYFDTIMRGYDDFGMSQREKDGLIDAAIRAGEYETEHLRNRPDMRRTAKGRYHRVATQPSFADYGQIREDAVSQERQQAIKDAQLKLYDNHDWMDFCTRHGIDPCDTDLLDDQTTVSDLIEKMRGRNDY
jgi:hypothetical protein